MNNRYYIDGLEIRKTNLVKAAEVLQEQAEQERSSYVCITNARAAYHAIQTPKYLAIQNASLMTLPDGKPLEIIARLRGHKEVSRTCGPDIFNEMCRLSEGKDYTHFFYGSTQEILDKMLANLKVKYPFLKIVGAVSPPFGTPEELANTEIIEHINRTQPTFVWLGLGAPKQEYVADILVKRIKQSIILGVGLVFEYEAGTVKRPPLWVQKAGFEWLYRISQQIFRIKLFLPAFFYIIKKIIKEFLSSLNPIRKNRND